MSARRRLMAVLAHPDDESLGVVPGGGQDVVATVMAWSGTLSLGRTGRSLP